MKRIVFLPIMVLAVIVLVAPTPSSADQAEKLEGFFMLTTNNQLGQAFERAYVKLHREGNLVEELCAEVLDQQPQPHSSNTHVATYDVMPVITLLKLTNDGLCPKNGIVVSKLRFRNNKALRIKKNIFYSQMSHACMFAADPDIPESWKPAAAALCKRHPMY
ncbi:MAG: hypothetical protein WC045_00160 [Patescibacteria group bacterium]